MTSRDARPIASHRQSASHRSLTRRSNPPRSSAPTPLLGTRPCTTPLGVGRDISRRSRPLQERRRAPEHGHHPPYRAQSAVTGQAHDQPEEPTQARRLERRLPQNHHPPHSLTFKRFPCKGLASNMSGRYEPHQNRSRTVAHPTLELHAKVYAEQPGLFRTGLYINYLG